MPRSRRSWARAILNQLRELVLRGAILRRDDARLLANAPFDRMASLDMEHTMSIPTALLFEDSWLRGRAPATYERKLELAGRA